MAKLLLKGIIAAITDVTTVGANNTKKQTLVLMIPGYTDSFGDKKGEDEYWPLEAVGDRIEKLKLDPLTMVNHKAECTVYVTGRRYVKDGKEMHFIGASLAELKLHGLADQRSLPATEYAASVPTGEVTI